jgi:glycosyltransferase involved in cell wall biosynthesis
MSPFSLSVVIMAYNEEANLPTQMDRTVAFLSTQTTEWQIVVVNDGSNDDTGSIAETYAARYPGQIDVIHHESNLGMGAAIRHGYAAARCDWVTQLPADCQVHPDTFHHFLPHTADSDLILSIYKKRGDGVLRRLLSSGFQFTIRMLLGQRGDFTGTMMFRRPLFDEVGTLHSNTFFLNMEFPIKALRAGTSFSIVEIEALPRLSGQSKVKNVRRIMRVFREVLAMRTRG